MNDEELVLHDTIEKDVPTCDPLQTDQASNAQCNEGAKRPTGETGETGEDDEDPTVLADSLPNPDPGASRAPEPTEENGLEQLRSELMRLRAELAERDRMLTRIGTECEEFRQLYPDASLSDLSDGVWEDVRRGVPIAAAFALSERRRQLTEQKAAQYNLTNSHRSAGSVAGGENEYFSPAEVRAMSGAEVRENYQKIMRSMTQWH